MGIKNGLERIQFPPVLPTKIAMSCGEIFGGGWGDEVFRLPNTPPIFFEAETEENMRRENANKQE
jgi:hypothetical protein